MLPDTMDTSMGDFHFDQTDQNITNIKSELNSNSYQTDAETVGISLQAFISADDQSACEVNWDIRRDFTNSFLGNQLPELDLPKFTSISEENNFLNIPEDVRILPTFVSLEETNNYELKRDTFCAAETELSTAEHSDVEHSFGFKVLETFSLQAETGGFFQAIDTKPLHQLSAEGFYRCGFEGGMCSYNTLVPAQFEVHLQEAHQDPGVFQCVHCGSVETTCDNLLQHLDQHLKLKYMQLVCPDNTCNFSASTPEELLAHLIIHDLNSFFTCRQCGQQFDSLKNILTHIKENLLQIVQCPHCSATDVDRKRIVTHISISHPSCCRMVSVYKILLCQERYQTGWQNWLKHQVISGTNMALEISRMDMLNQSPDTVPESKPPEENTFSVTTLEKKSEHFKDTDLCQEKKIGIIQPLTVQTDVNMQDNFSNMQRHGSELKESCSEKSKHGTLSPRLWQDCLSDPAGMKCEFCKEVFFKEEMYIHHLFSAHSESFSGFACTTCNFISMDPNVSSTHRCTTLRLQPKSKFSVLSESLLSQHVEEEFLQKQSASCHKRKICADNSPPSSGKYKKNSHKSLEEMKGETMISPTSSVSQKSLRVYKGKPIHCRLCGCCTGRSKWGAYMHVYLNHSEVLQCPICKFCPVNQASLYKHLTVDHYNIRDSLYQEMHVRKWLEFPGDKKHKNPAGRSNLEVKGASPQVITRKLLTSKRSHSVSASESEPRRVTGNKVISEPCLANTKPEREKILEHSSCRTRGIDAWREVKLTALPSEPDSQVALHLKEDNGERGLPPIGSETEMEYRCPYCVTIRKSEESFYYHLCFHLHYKTFKCDYCAYEAFSKNTILNHISSLHPEHSVDAAFKQIIDEAKERKCRLQIQNCCVPVSEPYDEKRLERKNFANKKNCKTFSSKMASSTNADISKVQSKKSKKASRASDEAEIYLMCPYCRSGRKRLTAVKTEIRGHLGYKPYSCHYCTGLSSSSEERIKAHIAQEHPGKPDLVDVTINEYKEQRVAELLERAHKLSKVGNDKKTASKNKSGSSGSGNMLGKSMTIPRTNNSIEENEQVNIQKRTSIESAQDQKQGCSLSSSSARPRDYFTVFQNGNERVVQCLYCNLTFDTKSAKFIEIYKKMGKHVYKHMPQIFPCDFCGRHFYPM